MARLTINVPDYLAKAAHDAGIDVSALAQSAITHALGAQATNAWLASLPKGDNGPTHEEAMAALDDARDEFGN